MKLLTLTLASLMFVGCGGNTSLYKGEGKQHYTVTSVYGQGPSQSAGAPIGFYTNPAFVAPTMALNSMLEQQHQAKIAENQADMPNIQKALVAQAGAKDVPLCVKPEVLIRSPYSKELVCITPITPKKVSK